MHYREMSITQGKKYIGFWMYLLTNIVLLIFAGAAFFTGHIIEGMAAFILLELREISAKLESNAS